MGFKEWVGWCKLLDPQVSPTRPSAGWPGNIKGSLPISGDFLGWLGGWAGGEEREGKMKYPPPSPAGHVVNLWSWSLSNTPDLAFKASLQSVSPNSSPLGGPDVAIQRGFPSNSPTFRKYPENLITHWCIPFQRCREWPSETNLSEMKLNGSAKRG